MTDTEFLSKLLDVNQPMTNNPVRISTVVLLLKSGRKLFGCDIESGIYSMNELNETNFGDGTYHSFQFTGLVNYLIFLEQIGSIFEPINTTIKSSVSKSNAIYYSLKYFSSLTDENKINAIVSLRNSMAHKFGLATEKNPRNKPPRKFILSNVRNSEVVNLPAIDWNGEFTDKSDMTSTTIFIIDLVEIIEEVYKKVKTENDNNKLKLALDAGMDELKARYTVIN